MVALLGGLKLARDALASTETLQTKDSLCNPSIHRVVADLGGKRGQRVGNHQVFEVFDLASWQVLYSFRRLGQQHMGHEGTSDSLRDAEGLVPSPE